MDGFDIDSRSILTEYDPDVYIFNCVLDGLPSWCPIVRNDKIIKSLFEAMRWRVDELLPQSEEEIEKMLVCGFSQQK